MILNVYQTISIGTLRVDSVSNSSVLQIGSAGHIQALSQLYNTGGFTGPAPQIGEASPSGSPMAPSGVPFLVALPNPN